MSSNPPPGLRILVVDDESTVRDTLSMLLGLDGHVVELARSAAEALDRLTRGTFDLVITDYEMEGMGGDRLAAAIKARAPAQRILMLTAYGELVRNDPNLMKHLDGLVPKPFPIEVLREAIACALAGRPGELNSSHDS